MEGVNDGLKWFGEGFDGFPKRLPEDCVEYTIYIIDSKFKDAEIRDKLRKVQSSANTQTKKLLKDFIWQREGFQFQLTTGKGKIITHFYTVELTSVIDGSFLYGQTNYGDSVEDEWLIVYLLRELSRLNPDIWIRIVDSDGEFLLVEAANALPRWLNPEVAEARVWINSARLLIIPLETGSEIAIEAQPLTIPEAQQYIQINQSKLLHSPMIEAEAFYRLEKYPQQIADSLHHALVQIPRKLAYILHEDAAYISPAVEAFYLRDPIALRPLQGNDISSLEFGPEDPVAVSAKFTKVGYAQLKSQQFTVPVAWERTVTSQDGTKKRNQQEIGMKMACGFEMLLADPQNKDNKAVREIKLLLEDLENGEATLPSDTEIEGWEKKDDDESWLDVDFNEFQKELAGKSAGASSAKPKAFTDKGAQENLRKMVARFENFMNDNSAGVEGAEFSDEMDDDDDDESNDSNDSNDTDEEGEDKEISFNEEEFATMMKQMMGIPTESAGNPDPAKPNTSANQTKLKDTQETQLHQTPQEPTLHQTTQQIETELRNAGVFRSPPNPQSPTSKPKPKPQITERKAPSQPNHSDGKNASSSEAAASSSSGDDDDSEVDIDVNLAKNLLESFKGQSGHAGPGGNLMGLMGLRMPRDEEADG